MTEVSVWKTKGHIYTTDDGEDPDRPMTFNLEFIGADDFDSARALVQGFAMEQTGVKKCAAINIQELCRSGDIFKPA